MKWDFSKLKLLEDEKIWLYEIYQLFLNNLFRPEIKNLKRKLISKLNNNFDPKKINSFLLRYGNEITPLGIYYFDPKTKIFNEIEKTIQTIKKIIEDGQNKEINIKELSKKLNYSISKTNKILFLIYSLGGKFWAGSSHERNGNFINIDIDREEVIDEYISYTNIEKYINEKLFVNRLIEPLTNKSTTKHSIKTFEDFVEINRINSLKKINSINFDLRKLIRLCEELNIANDNESFFSIAFLIRSILDHIPPIFERKNFIEVVNNSSKSGKSILQNLENTSRKIADTHLHSQISKKELLPNLNQTNFRAELDYLICEIIKKLS